MSSYVFMKILESAPQRYDRGIRMLSGGHIEEIYQRVARRAAAPGARLLDIGCGTGNLSLACAARGANVVGIDINAGMLEVARAKPRPANGSVEWVELGAAEIEDRFAEATFDAIVSCLAFSELGADEQSYVLRIALSRLRPGGTLIIADEVLPPTAAARLRHRLWRWPMALATYALTQTTTHPVRQLAARVRQAGFTEVEESRLPSGAFAIVSARKRKEVPS